MERITRLNKYRHWAGQLEQIIENMKAQYRQLQGKNVGQAVLAEFVENAKELQVIKDHVYHMLSDLENMYIELSDGGTMYLDRNVAQENYERLKREAENPNSVLRFSKKPSNPSQSYIGKFYQKEN